MCTRTLLMCYRPLPVATLIEWRRSPRQRVRTGRRDQPLGHPVDDVVESVGERALIELDRCPQRESIELYVGEVLEQDVDGVGCTARALELLPRQDGLVGF